VTEAALTTAILAALERAGHWAIRINSGRLRTASGWVQLAPRGTPDICVIHPRGWIEVKLPGLTTSQQRRQSNPETIAAQAAWRARADRLGVRHAVVTSVVETLRIVGEWEK
jgi:hypothetical protein